MKHYVLALLASAAVSSAYAQPDSAYYGLALGEFDYDEGDGFGNDFVQDTVSTWRVMVGYQFMKHLAIEGGYGETSTIRDTAQIIVFPGVPAQLDYVSDIKMLTLRLLGVLPFDNGLSLVGGLSYADVEQDISLSDGNDQVSFEFSSNDPAYYVGAQYDWDRIALRLAYEKYDFDGDVDAAETTITFFYKL